MLRRKVPHEWIQMFTLPNISIDEPVEIDGVAMVSVHDERAQTLARRHKRFSMYLNRFTSEFGQQTPGGHLAYRHPLAGSVHQGFI
jgi:hypothetical protein